MSGHYSDAVSAIRCTDSTSKQLKMLLQPNPEIWGVIEQRRMIRLVYHNRVRIVEHDHGILNGSVQLLAYQIDGSSSRRFPTGY